MVKEAYEEKIQQQKTMTTKLKLERCQEKLSEANPSNLYVQSAPDYLAPTNAP